MINDQDRKFARRYVDYKQKNRIDYLTNEFLYGHVGPWPQPAYDHPFAQPPVILNIPGPEAADWKRYVGAYYNKSGRDFGADAVKYAGTRAYEAYPSGYTDVDDATFATLVCEGLFSKFLCELDASDRQLFEGFLADEASYEYLKSDFSCMEAVETPWGFGDGEDGTNNPQHVLPTIVLVRRPRNDVQSFRYDVIAIAACKYDLSPAGFRWQGFTPELVFTPKNTEVWWLTKLYALQGAIHRINLVDHTKVHFPNETVNAVTKSTLPRWHWVHKLLVPHFFLTMPVNDAVLEADRSLINRQTWYPWNPFAAKGAEVRKLLAYGWIGAPDESPAGASAASSNGNSSYPGFAFSDDPTVCVDANRPDKTIKTFIGLKASRYALFLEEYLGAVQAFTTGMVEKMWGDDRRVSHPAQVALEQLEVQNWACHIARLLPGFPDEDEILEPGRLARVLAAVIWNASVVHSSDHTLLHQLFESESAIPIPYVIRVPPPKCCDQLPATSLKGTLSDKYRNQWDPLVQKILGLGHSWTDRLTDAAIAAAITAWAKPLDPKGNVPLCWPSDVAYARMADLLFYLPHNTVTLYKMRYEWLDAPELVATWPAGRPLIDEALAAALDGEVASFRQQLAAVDQDYFPPGGPPKWADQPLLKFPRLQGATRDEEVTACIGSSIQY